MITSTAWPVLRRYTGASWRPAVVLLATATIAAGWRGNPLTPDATPADQAATTHMLAAILFIVGAAALTRLTITVRRLVRQPARDEEAHVQLEDIRAAASRPGGQLLEVHRIQWAVNAGQRAWVIDTANGAIIDYWFAGHTFSPGCFVLVGPASHGGEILSYLPADCVAAAGRHAERTRLHRSEVLTRDRSQRARQEGVEAKAVVEAAERLLGR